MCEDLVYMVCGFMTNSHKNSWTFFNLPSLIYSRYSECQRSSSSRMVPRSDTMIKADCTRIDRDHTTKKPIISCKNSYWQVSVVSNSGIWSTAVMIKTVSLKKMDGINERNNNQMNPFYDCEEVYKITNNRSFMN